MPLSSESPHWPNISLPHIFKRVSMLIQLSALLLYCSLSRSKSQTFHLSDRSFVSRPAPPSHCYPRFSFCVCAKVCVHTCAGPCGSQGPLSGILFYCFLTVWKSGFSMNLQLSVPVDPLASEFQGQSESALPGPRGLMLL